MSNEQRQSRRFRSQPGNQRAVLKFDKTEVPVRLDDESSGGFSVTTYRDIPVEVGQIVMLKTSRGWHTVEIRRKEIRSIEAQLGLLCLGAVVESPRLGGALSYFTAVLRKPVQTSRRGMLVYGLVVALALGGMYWAWGEIAGMSWRDAAIDAGPVTGGVWTGNGSSANGKHRSGESAFLSGRDSLDDPAPGTFGAGALKDRSSAGSPSLSSGQGLALPISGRQFDRHVLERLDRLASLTSPELAEELGLTSSQQEAVRDVLTETSRIMAQRSNNSRDDEYVDRANSLALEVLNPQQRRSWLDRFSGGRTP